MTRRQPETILQKAIVQYLNLRGIFCWVNKTTGTWDPTRKVFRKGTTMRGISDILGVMPNSGKILAIEVKMPKKYPNPEQRDFLSNVQRRGGIAFVARSVDDVKREIDQIASFMADSNL